MAKLVMTIDSDEEMELRNEEVLLSASVVLNEGKPKQEQGSKQMWDFAGAVVPMRAPEAETTGDEKAPFQMTIEERV